MSGLLCKGIKPPIVEDRGASQPTVEPETPPNVVGESPFSTVKVRSTDPEPIGDQWEPFTLQLYN